MKIASVFIFKARILVCNMSLRITKIEFAESASVDTMTLDFERDSKDIDRKIISMLLEQQ